MRARVLSGELEPGVVIDQALLAREIGISTTPLREALRRLAQQGLVELDAHRDARVMRLSAEEARDLPEVRLRLDPLAASLAAQRRSPADVAEMRAALEGLHVLSGSPAVEELIAHRRLHAAVHRAAGNQLLAGMLDGLWDTADRYRRHGLRVERTDEDRERTAREHAALVEAIAVGDGEAAAGIMRGHVGSSLGARSARLLAEPVADPS